ncbi:MAG: PAS domain-containing protein [Dehalococcoidales bacterium]|nr:PAS domain-containing protein [Dehalococcoidales bacterium]
MEKQVSTRHEGYLEALLNASPLGILAINADGKITFANKEAAAIFECEMRDLLGENIATVYASEEEAKETNRKLFASGGAIRDHESRGKTKKGKIVPLRISAAHMIIGAQYTGAVGFFEPYRPWTAAEAKVKARVEETEAKLEELRKLSIPIFELYPGLTMVEVIGNLDAARWANIAASLLSNMETSKSRVILIDLSPAMVANKEVAAELVKTIRTVHLLGAQCIIAGIQTPLASAVESLITDISSVMSFRALDAALQAALNQLGYNICENS